MLTLTTKKVNGVFMPVGEEDSVAVIQTPDGFVTILVDEDGYTKAQSRALKKDEAMKIFRKAREEGILEYSGGQVKIWMDVYPTIHDNSK